MSELQLMTDESFEGFVAAGCRPACHICRQFISRYGLYSMRTIPAGDVVKMVDLESKGMVVTVEIMVCNLCVDKDTPQRELDYARQVISVSAPTALQTQKSEPVPVVRKDYSAGGCMRVNGRIIPGMS